MSKNTKLFGVLLLKSKSLFKYLVTKEENVHMRIISKIFEEIRISITMMYFVHLFQSDRCEFWNFSDDIKSIDEAGCKFGM